jgi:hypothetical protein
MPEIGSGSSNALGGASRRSIHCIMCIHTCILLTSRFGPLRFVQPRPGRPGGPGATPGLHPARSSHSGYAGLRTLPNAFIYYTDVSAPGIWPISARYDRAGACHRVQHTPHTRAARCPGTYRLSKRSTGLTSVAAYKVTGSISIFIGLFICQHGNTQVLSGWCG